MPEDEEEKPKKQGFRISDVPPGIKIVSLAVIGYFVLKGNMESSKLFGLIIIIILVWYFMAKDIGKEGDVLTPEEAYKKLLEQIQLRKDQKRIPFFTKVYVYNDNLKFHNSMPTYYIYGLEYHHVNSNIEYKRAFIWAKGELKGFTVIHDSFGKTTGHEVVPSRLVLPEAFKMLKREGLLSSFVGKGGSK